MKSFIILLISFLAFHSVVVGQGRFDSVMITETQLTDKIYMLEGSGGNIGLYLGEEEALIIDNQFGPLSEKIMTKVFELSGKEITKVINTHWHGDHAGGNENFGNSGAMIFAHENVRKRMSSEHKRGEQVTPPSPEIALPVVTYNGSMQLYFMGEPILITHAHSGSHTDGDSFVFFPESNVMHMGDCFFHQRFPFIDISSGGTLDGLISAAEAALMIADDATQIIPGHGPMATKADLVKYHEFLKIVRERAFSFVENGRGADMADPAKIIEGYEEWAFGYINAERFTNIIFESLSGNN